MLKHYMFTALIFTALLLTDNPTSQASETELEILISGRSARYSLTQLQSKLKSVTLTIDDPVYKTKKSYRGFPLLDILKLAGLTPESGSDEIVFTAKDGYAPNTAFVKLREHRPIVAFTEVGKKHFEKVRQGKAMVSPGPFYLVWEEGKALAESVPWPYQLIRIEVVNFREKYAKLYPDSSNQDSPTMRGFRIFKDQCLRCHSINLQGGNLGPELNAPQNITEYWAKDTLRRFIRNAPSFRYRSKMPPFPALSDADLDSILAYLEYMKERKSAL